jgi:hypothetical protein
MFRGGSYPLVPIWPPSGAIGGGGEGGPTGDRAGGSTLQTGHLWGFESVTPAIRLKVTARA